jgi:alcohol dehydrogenase class IV
MDTAKIASIAATANNIAREDINQYVIAGAPRHGLPKILIPTTSGTGSEVSIAAVFTDENGVKKAVIGDCVLADMAVVDPLMTLNMPAKITADSGMDVLSHAIEGYTSLKSNVMSDMFAETTIKLVAENLRTAYCKGSRNLEARYNMAIAATFASKVFDLSIGANINHGMGHTLQSMGVHCTHGVSCTIMLPHTMEFNMIANLPKYARIAELMGEKVEGLSLRGAAHKAVDEVRNLASDIAMPQRLQDIGVKKEDIPKLVDILFTFSAGCVDRNPRNLTREDAASIFEAAW